MEDYVGKNGIHWSSVPSSGRKPNGEFDASDIGPAEHCRGIKSASPDISVIRKTERNRSIYKSERWTILESQTHQLETCDWIGNVEFHQYFDCSGSQQTKSFQYCEYVDIVYSVENRFLQFCYGKKSVQGYIHLSSIWWSRNQSFSALQQSNNKLEPIRQIFDMFVENCRKSYNPPCVLTIDERLCLFRGKIIKKSTHENWIQSTCALLDMSYL